MSIKICLQNWLLVLKLRSKNHILPQTFIKPSKLQRTELQISIPQSPSKDFAKTTHTKLP